jgi:hypothetical protein
MPEQKTIERAREDARRGKSPSTQAGEFVREEIHHIRERKHGARSPQQAIAIGLSKARRAGVKLGKPKGSRSRATEAALKREPRSSASKSALSRQTNRAAAKRGKRARNAAAAKAVRTRAAA